MTQEVFGSKWQDDVIGLAVENGDVELNTGDTETLAVRAVFNGSMLPQRKDTKNITIAEEDAPASTALDTSVGAHDGVITAGSTPGVCIVSVTLDNAPTGLDPVYVKVTVQGE